MYASGLWLGFWVQPRHGRQEMRAFELHFDSGLVTGGGADIIGPFVVRGEYRPDGRVELVKQYLGKHRVHYRGQPDGEGSIYGTWEVTAKYSGESYAERGPFLMKPDRVTTSDLSIAEIRPRK